MNAPSLISKDESVAIKGLLILLIAFGHDRLITTNLAIGERTFVWHWLYTFHVYVFLILPFIYGYHGKGEDTQDDKQIIDFKRVAKDIGHYLKKFGVPYCWFFLISAFVFVTVGGDFDLLGMLYAFVFGDEQLMDKYIGFNFVWFLPSMISLSVLKSVWYNSKAAVRTAIIFISSVLWILAIFKVVTRYKLAIYVPFAIAQAFYFVVLGIFSRSLVKKIRFSMRSMAMIFLLMAALAVLFYFRREISNISIHQLAYLVMPVLAFLLLFGLREVLSKFKLLKIIGKYSLQIYLLHVYVVNALVAFVLHFLPESVWVGVAVYILTMAISIALSMAVAKMPILNKVLFYK